MRIALDNLLARPGAVTTLGSPVDLGAIEVDNYVVAGLNDHIVPWENAFRSGDLLGGDTRLVLSTSGHIQALINPPGPESRASYSVGADRAEAVRGSWWPDYVGWLDARSGEHKPAPGRLGSRRHKALAKAPGSYVHAG
jgi:poly[(R)-3-hydroxyalkanoate] polymerase subunit PhaC